MAPLEDRVNEFVQWLFRHHKTSIPRGPKVINDSLLGNQYFSRHEIVVIDSPLLQRLKRIKQTGLVYHVFPSATHSRFEHSLGATTLAERCFRAIYDRTLVEFGKAFADDDRLSGDLAHVRMSALLHDVGHGLCSHAAEQIYSWLTDLREFKRDPAFVKNAPGGILSYLIVRSPTFQNWFQENVVEACGANLSLDVIGNMILGKHPDNDKFFLGQIISSPYDADKLDYIARDSYYCGLALTIDLLRFYSMISVATNKGYKVLVLRDHVPLEQILFSKMILTGSVYHHQKVKCLDSMLLSTIQHIKENPGDCSIRLPDREITFAEPVEFLYATDDDFFNFNNHSCDAYTNGMLWRFWGRDLFSRCLRISRRTVRNWSAYARALVIDLGDQPDRVAEIEGKILDKLTGATSSEINLLDVRLCIPDRPKTKRTSRSYRTCQVHTWRA